MDTEINISMIRGKQKSHENPMVIHLQFWHGRSVDVFYILQCGEQ